MPHVVTALPTALAERKLRTLRAHPQVTGARVGLIKAASPQAGQESGRLQGSPEGEVLPKEEQAGPTLFFVSEASVGRRELTEEK